MSDVLQAAVAHFKGYPPLSAVDGPWLDVVPKGRPFPNCAYGQIGGGSTPRRTFDKTEYEPVTLRFSVQATTSTQAAELLAAMQTRFEKQPIAGLMGVLQVERRDSYLRMAGNIGTQRVYQAVATYRLTIERDA